MKIWFSEEPFGRSYVVNLRETFLPGPGFEPESTALCTGALTNSHPDKLLEELIYS